MNDLLDAMRARIETELASVTPAVVVVKGPLEPDKWPAAERYLIELVPGETGRTEYDEDSCIYREVLSVTIKVFVRRWDEAKSAYGTAAGELGVVAICKQVQAAVNGVDLGPVWGGRMGGEAQEYKAPLDDDEAARHLGGPDGNLRARFWRVGLVDYEGWSKPKSIRS